MDHVYVAELLALLRALEIEQRQVASHLGASRTQVSLWANGHRPLPRKFEQPFLAYVDHVMHARLDEAWAHNHAPPTPHLLSASSAETLEDTLLHTLHRWDLECYARSGTLTQTLERQRAILRSYDHLDPLKLDDADFAHYLTACRQAYRQLRLLAHWRRRGDLTEGRLLTPPGREEISPSQYLWAIYARYYGQHADEDVATADDEADGVSGEEPGASV
jgi:hypothetical protein